MMPYSRCAATRCLAAAVTYLAAVVPVCQEHLVALRDDLVQRDMIKAPMKRLPPPRPELNRPSLVYYIRIGEAVKIGTTAAPARRWYRLSRDAGSLQVLMAESGGQSLELKRHAQFVKLRIRATESFREDGSLRDHIAMLGEENPGWWENVVVPVHEQSSPKGRARLAKAYTKW